MRKPPLDSFSEFWSFVNEKTWPNGYPDPNRKSKCLGVIVANGLSVGANGETEISWASKAIADGVITLFNSKHIDYIGVTGGNRRSRWDISTPLTPEQDIAEAKTVCDYLKHNLADTQKVLFSEEVSHDTNDNFECLANLLQSKGLYKDIEDVMVVTLTEQMTRALLACFVSGFPNANVYPHNITNTGVWGDSDALPTFMSKRETYVANESKEKRSLIRAKTVDFAKPYVKDGVELAASFAADSLIKILRGKSKP